MEGIVIDFKQTGVNKIDIDRVLNKWNHLWWLNEWRGAEHSWRLVKYVRKDSPMTALKLTISEDQARELIEKLELKSINSAFRSGFSWRRQIDTDNLEEWRMNKINKKHK